MPFLSLLLAVVSSTTSISASAASSTTSALPPIVSSTGNGDAPFTFQVFSAGPVALDIKVWTVAERYLRGENWNGSVPTLNTMVVCEIADDGTINRSTCEAESWKNREQVLAMSLIHVSPRTALPKFPAIDREVLGLTARGSDPLWSKLVQFSATPGDKPPFFRLVRLAVRIDESPLTVDLTTGRLVKFTQADLLSGEAMSHADYPARALRDKRQGVQTVECQVQSDRSILCQSVSFDPSENAPYFAGVPKTLYTRAIAKGLLADGTSSSGVRFQTRLRWVLPDGE